MEKINLEHTKTFSDLKKQILLCIHTHRITFKIIDSYFHIKDVEILKKNEGKIEFSLGPSFEFEEKWTIKELAKKQEKFYKDLQVILNKTDFDFIKITTEYRGRWEVTGYEIKIGYTL